MCVGFSFYSDTHSLSKVFLEGTCVEKDFHSIARAKTLVSGGLATKNLSLK